jgi:predicted NAD/FAD-binding protein
MKVAVIGSGISGVASAYYLNKYGVDVTIFEAGHYFGGHTNTIDIEIDGNTEPIDTGFLVHNDRTYPNLIDFFEELDIETHPSDMSFSVKCISDNMVWAGTDLTTVFTQKKNIFSLRFYRFIYNLLRFNSNSQKYLNYTKSHPTMTLGELLDKYNYSEDFRNWYLLPMGGCIWSTPTKNMLDFPAYTFIRFCINHGLLQITDRPQWKTVVKGCRTYVEKALLNIDKKFINEPVESITPLEAGVRVKSKNKDEVFDYCFVCSHPPEALKFLNIESETREILENFKYQKNIAVLHHDETILPEKKAWSSWNYLSNKSKDGEDAVSVSYLINMLQPLKTKTPIVVTLNPVCEIKKDHIFREIEYEHPLFDVAAIKAQKKIEQLQGNQGVFFAGAWMRYGFHEDGILSAKKAVNDFFKQTNREAKGFEVL